MLEDIWQWLNQSRLEFRDPLFLLAALSAPVLYFLAARMPSAVTYSSLALADRAPRSLKVRLSRLPALLLAFAALALAIALAGPRSGDASSKITREGIAIMLAVDRSGSMDARDFVADDYSVSRLDAVKNVLREFVLGGDAGAGRSDDLLGIVAFGTYADGLCPLTLDHGNLLAILDNLQVAREREESATAIGEGLGLAVERLRRHQARSKIIVLLSDGVNNAGELDPLLAAELALNQGIKVYTIGAGTSGFAPMPVYDDTGRMRHLRRATVEIDETTLKKIANLTGGRYFHARDAAALADVYAEIDKLERSEVSELRFLQYREYYPLFLLGAFILIACATLLNSTLLRRLP